MKDNSQIPKPWIEARKRFQLSRAHVQMGLELGLNPRKFKKYANREQAPWEQPVPQYIEHLYFKRFGKRQPDAVFPKDESAESQRQEAEARPFRKFDWRSPDRKSKSHSRPGRNVVASRDDSRKSPGAGLSIRKKG